MATKWKSKGCSVLISISSVYTAIPGIKDFSVSGEASQTFNVKTLDLTQFEENPSNGFSTCPTVQLNYFWDPTNAVHIVMDALPGTPTATNIKTTYSDTGPKSYIYAATGFAKDVTASGGDGLSASFTFTTSGAPT